MFEKSPIGSVVVLNAFVFNRDSIFVTKKEDLLKNLKLQQHFVKNKVLTASMLIKLPSNMESFLKMI